MEGCHPPRSVSVTRAGCYSGARASRSAASPEPLRLVGRGILNVASMADWSRSGLDRGARHQGGKEQSPRAKGFPSLAKQRIATCEANGFPGDTFGIRGKAWLGACCVLTAMCSVVLAADRRPRSNTLVPRDFFEGKELFEKSWEPGKPSPTGGDGLGPLYNETSCVGCHHQGGTGGGGDERSQRFDADGRRRFGRITEGSQTVSGRDGRPAPRVPEPCQHRAPPARDHRGDSEAAERRSSPSRRCRLARRSRC